MRLHGATQRRHLTSELAASVLLPVVGAIAAVVVAVVAQTRPLTAVRVGAVISSLILVAAGVVLMRRARGLSLIHI